MHVSSRSCAERAFFFLRGCLIQLQFLRCLLSSDGWKQKKRTCQGFLQVVQLSLLSIQEKSIDSGLKNQWWELCRDATEYGVPKTTLKDRPSGRVIHGTKSGRQLIWRCRPFSFPILVGGEEGKGLVAQYQRLVQMTSQIYCIINA